LKLRVRRAKNCCALLFLASGTPMLRAGDEFLQTQKGNNNPYNQDNETTWLDWSLLQRNAEVFRFFRAMIRFRRAHPTLGRSRFWREDVRWFGPGPAVDMGANSHTLALYLDGASQRDVDLYVLINGCDRATAFEIQVARPGGWRRVLDTGLESPADFPEPAATASPLAGTSYRLEARSIAVLWAAGRKSP
jgi:isoamylase